MTNNSSYTDPMDTCLSIAHKRSTGDASYPYHRHSSCEIFLFLQGNVRFYIEKFCYKLSSNDLIILNPNEMHRIVCDDDSLYERVTINLEKHYIHQLSHPGINLSACFYQRPIGKNNILPMTTDQVQELLHLTKSLQHTVDYKEYGYPIKRDAYASLLLLFVHNLFCHRTNTYTNIMPNYILETMQYLEQNLDKRLDLALLEKKFRLNGRYLSQEFKKHTGITLRAFLLDRKLARAKSLLLEGKNVTEACYLSGFNDYANFVRTFKKAEGISPGKYKRTYHAFPT